jgi:hypothetical protein
MFYNFTRIHKTLRVTPAMQAGVTGHVWDVSDIVALVEAEEAQTDRKRGPYKKRVTLAPAYADDSDNCGLQSVFFVCTAAGRRFSFDLFMPNALDMNAIGIKLFDCHSGSSRFEAHPIAHLETHVTAPALEILY